MAGAKKKSAPTRKSDDALVDSFRNRIRGAIASLRTSPTGKNAEQKWRTEQQAIRVLNQALSDARRKLPHRALQKFEAWADEFTRGQLQAERIGTSAVLIGILPTRPPLVPLAQALRDARDALVRAKRLLHQYCVEAHQLSRLILTSRWVDADQLVDKIAATFGHSYWSMETKIAIQQFSGHAEKAREIGKKWSAGSQGLNRFYLYYFSIRGEPSQSSARFKALIVKRLNESKLEKANRTYAAYRVTGSLPIEDEELGQVLTLDGLTTRIDLLHTSVKVAATLLATRSRYTQDVLEPAEQILNEFRDPLFDSLITSNTQNANELRVPDEVRRALSESVKIVINADDSLASDTIGRGLASLITYGGSEADQEQLKKFLLNFNWLPESLFLSIYPDIAKVADVLPQLRMADSQPLHLPLDEELRLAVKRTLQDSGSKADGYLQRISRDPGIDPTEVAGSASPLWTVEHLSGIAIECVSIDGAKVAYDTGDYASCVAISANAPLHNPRLVAGLPLGDLFGSGNWKRISAYGASLEVCCCLHQYLAINDDRKVRTFKRFAIEALMKSKNEESLAKLGEKLIQSESNTQLVAYFLTTVCDLPTLELLPRIEGSRQALQLRAEILREASKITTTSAAQLLSEADLIDAQLEVDSALDVLDDSMVYVDEEPLLTRATKELSPDFERYKQLLAAGIGETISLEELLRDVRQQSASVFQVPKNDAEDMLVQMVDALRMKFIDDPVNGLESVIGRRIRHGTISSELRGTLEHMDMIGQRPRTGADYDAPAFAIEISAALEPRLRKAVNGSFARFSQAIDALVAQLRDEVFRCASAGKMKPAFELQLSPFIVAVARSLAIKCATIRQFSSECFQIFWFALSPIVDRERVIVDEFSKRSLADIFSKLIHDLRSIGIIDPTALSKIQFASETLQLKAALISSWVRVPRLSLDVKTYPLTLVFDVALAMVKSQRTGFEPKIEAKIVQDVVLDAHGFPLVHDALRIALENIAQHSGIKSGNRVEVQIYRSDDGHKLCFLLQSDVAKDAWTKERSQKFEQIRGDIEKQNFDRARKDRGGSGLTRLAGIVHQGSDTRFAASIDENRRFKLYFELVYISLNEVLPALEAVEVG